MAYDELAEERNGTAAEVNPPPLCELIDEASKRNLSQELSKDAIEEKLESDVKRKCRRAIFESANVWVQKGLNLSNDEEAIQNFDRIRERESDAAKQYQEFIELVKSIPNSSLTEDDHEKVEYARKRLRELK